MHGQEHGADAAEGGGGAVGVESRATAVANELVVEVLSNWGHDKVVGLTEVELFDSAGARIRLANAQVCTLVRATCHVHPLLCLPVLRAARVRLFGPGEEGR